MLRRFSMIVGTGLFAAFLWSGLFSSNTSALSVTETVKLSPSNFAVLDIGDLDCTTDDEAISFETGGPGGVVPTGIDINANAFVNNYIICPVTGLMYSSVGLILNVLQGSGLLEIQPLLSSGSPTGDTAGMYAAWTVFRDVANFGLIIGMFMVIFSQATSYGLSAYGVRKMLPKIIIAALLVNMSYIICAVLVDIFNILGASLDNVLSEAITDRINAAGGLDLEIGEILSTAAIGVTGALMASSSLFPLILIMLFLILLIILIMGIVSVFFLIARQVLVVILIIAAPLAFIAWLFPNTEQHFRKWWSTFVRLLAIYPVVMSLNAVVIVLLIALSALMEAV